MYKGTRNAVIADRYIEAISGHSTFEMAYLRDLTEVMHHDIKPVRESMRLVGRAFTISGPAIYINALEAALPGSVIVWGDTNEGEGLWSASLSWRISVARGIRGVVIDGGAYKSSELKRSELPVFCRYFTPRPAANKLEGTMQEPVSCGGVMVYPDDIIVGDADGVVVIARARQDEVLEGLKIMEEGFEYFDSMVFPEPLMPSEDPDLRMLFEYKDANPDGAWRKYREWAERLREKYGSSTDLRRRFKEPGSAE